MTRQPFFLIGYLGCATAFIVVFTMSVVSPARSAGLPTATSPVTPARNAATDARQRSGAAGSGGWHFLYMERDQTPVTVGPFANARQCNQLKQFAINRGSKSYPDAAERYLPRYSGCWQS